MPKVIYDTIRGLIQEGGSGIETTAGPLQLHSYEMHDNVTETLNKTTIFHLADPANGAATLTLPANPPMGMVKVIIVIDNSNNTVIKSTNTTLGGDLTFTQIGDGAIAFGLGASGWCLLRSNS